MADDHHLVYGMLTDAVSGELIEDTDDERLRQRLARYLFEEKGYFKDDLQVRLRHDVSGSGYFGYSITDIAVLLERRIVMILRYGPGSLVSRERPTLAAARTLVPGQIIPIAVVTNGREAEVLDVRRSRLIGIGLDAIPDRTELAYTVSGFDFSPVSDKQVAAEKRILMAYDGIEHSCACAEDWCKPSQ